MPRSVGVSLRATACFLIGGAFALSPALFSTEAEASSRWLLFTGGFHPVVLHLPIGLLIAVAAFEVWSVASRKNEMTLRRFLWLSVAVSAALSLVTGFALATGGGHDAELLDRHLWLAGAFTALCWFSLGILQLKDIPVFRFTAFGIVGVLMMATGHFGGLMVHGSPFVNAPWRPDPTAIEILPPPGEEIQVYAELVHPILTAKCQSCHGPGKQNGRLRLDSLERALVGGTHGPALVPGRAQDSLLLESILLPLEDEEHMPPKNRPQLNQAEVDLLHWWIETGALKDTIFAAQDAPEVIQPFLVPSYRLLPDRELLAQQAKEEEKRLEEQTRRRAQLEASLAQVEPRHRAWFHFASDVSADLEFAVTTSPEAFGDEQLAALASLLRECSHITLAGTRVTDAGLAELRLSSALRELNLRQTPVGNDGVRALAGTANLETLNIYGTAVDDALVSDLPQWPVLKRLFIGDTRLSGDSLAALRRVYAHAEVIGSLSLPAEIVQSAAPAAPITP